MSIVQENILFPFSTILRVLIINYVTSKWSFCGLRRGDKHIDVLLLQDNCRNKTVGKIVFTLLLLCTLMAYSGLCSGGGGSLFPIFLDLFHKILKILGGGAEPWIRPCLLVTRNNIQAINITSERAGGHQLLTTHWNYNTSM